MKDKGFYKKSQHVILNLSPLLLAICFFICLFYSDNANSGPYLNSAHGNSAYGVDRSSLSAVGYSKGNCVHCHEQHASIGGSEPAPTANNPSKFCLLADNFSGVTTKPYVQSDNVCFSCHISTGTFQSPSFSNYNYSATFGGCSIADCPTSNIFDAFNSLSYHNLYDIYRFITGLSGTKIFPNFPDDSNPCSSCHNIHIARKSCGNPSGSFDATKAAISKPSDHSNLWGDDIAERMSNYTAGYQSPYWKYNNTPSNYEPANSSTYDGTNLPDYVTFCMDCHTNIPNSVLSTTLNRWLKPIGWSNEKHGNGDGDAILLSPYTIGPNYVTSCTDCHEPHGATNVYLIRKEVNGSPIIAGIPKWVSIPTDSGFENGGEGWASLCERCHGDTVAIGTVHHGKFAGDCLLCHGMNPDPLYDPCTNCHYHGSTYTNIPLGYNNYPTF